MRPRSRLSRTLHALTALVAVWCLGCAGFDPLFSSLAARPGSAAMDCASEGGVAVTSSVDEWPSAGEPAADQEQGSATCGCQSCLAPAPTVVAAAPASPAAPDGPAERFTAPTSIERAPLVPPPQQVA